MSYTLGTDVEIKIGGMWLTGCKVNASGKNSSDNSEYVTVMVPGANALTFQGQQIQQNVRTAINVDASRVTLLERELAEVRSRLLTATRERDNAVAQAKEVERQHDEFASKLRTTLDDLRRPPLFKIIDLQLNEEIEYLTVNGSWNRGRVSSVSADTCGVYSIWTRFTQASIDKGELRRPTTSK